MTKNEVRIATEIINILQCGKSVCTGGFLEEGYWLNDEQNEFLEPFFKHRCIFKWGFYQQEGSLWLGTSTFEEEDGTEKHLVNLDHADFIIEMLKLLILFKNRIKYSDAIKEPTKIN